MKTAHKTQCVYSDISRNPRITKIPLSVGCSACVNRVSSPCKCNIKQNTSKSSVFSCFALASFHCSFSVRIVAVSLLYHCTRYIFLCSPFVRITALSLVFCLFFISRRFIHRISMMCIVFIVCIIHIIHIISIIKSP